jgi:cell division protein DivIC
LARLTVVRAQLLSRLAPSLIALFLLPMLAYATYSIADRWYQSYVLALEEADIRREIEALRQENLRLQADLVYTRSDRYVEKIAREQLNLIKPGDRALILVGPPGTSAPQALPRRDVAPPAEKPAWRKLLELIFGR